MSEFWLHRKSGRLVALALAGVTAFSMPPPAAATPTGITGRATVIDGDTLEIGAETVRLEGIDAPEGPQRCGRRFIGTWACGTAASNALRRLVDGADVTCQPRGRDKYHRMLGICSVGGREINAEMVRSGMAWAFVKYSNSYTAVEAEARAERAGIWQGEAQPAWDFRASRWAAADDTAPNGCAIKGNVSPGGHIYHMPWSPWYAKVRVESDKGEHWFCSEEEAKAAGFRPAIVN